MIGAAAEREVTFDRSVAGYVARQESFGGGLRTRHSQRSPQLVADTFERMTGQSPKSRPSGRFERVGLPLLGTSEGGPRHLRQTVARRTFPASGAGVRCSDVPGVLA